MEFDTTNVKRMGLFNLTEVIRVETNAKEKNKVDKKRSKKLLLLRSSASATAAAELSEL